MKMRKTIGLMPEPCKNHLWGFLMAACRPKIPASTLKYRLLPLFLRYFVPSPRSLFWGFLHNFAYTNLRISPRTFPLTLNGTMVLHQLQLPYKSFSVNGNNAWDKCVQKFPADFFIWEEIIPGERIPHLRHLPSLLKSLQQCLLLIDFCVIASAQGFVGSFDYKAFLFCALQLSHVLQDLRHPFFALAYLVLRLPAVSLLAA